MVNPDNAFSTSAPTKLIFIVMLLCPGAFFTVTVVDYIFLEVNADFEEMTGLKRDKVIGKKVTEVLLGIEKSDCGRTDVYEDKN